MSGGDNNFLQRTPQGGYRTMSQRPLRRTQAIAPFGVGAMVDFPGPVSLIHCGLDAWPLSTRDPAHQEFRIEDEKRLAERLGVRYFIQPPDFRYVRPGEGGDQQNLNLKMPFLRFPRWHVCPRCGRMFEAALHDKSAPTCVGPVATGKGKGQAHTMRKTVQVRFIAACMNGHLQDFPWWEWVLKNSNPNREGRLRMITSGSASLAGVTIRVERNTDEIHVIESRTLAGAFEFDPGRDSALSKLGVFCRGDNPALGIPSATHASPGCGGHLYSLLRGGSNVYFPHVVSAIYLPPIDGEVSEEILEILEDPYVWATLSTSAKVAPERLVDTAQLVLQERYPDRKLDPKQLAEATNRRLKKSSSGSVKKAVETDSTEQAFRREEYELFGRDVQEGYPKTNLLIRTESISNFEPFIRDSFTKISLIHKLRETRAFVGFSRIFATDNLTEQERRSLISRTPQEWLPAVVVRGEGIFLQLKEDAVRAWLSENGAAIQTRISMMSEAVQQLRERRRQDTMPVSPRFILLHTLAHILINQLVYECGYGSASLRERLYSSDDATDSMAGILLYTAAGDSEGTMGGLVRMGKPGRLEAVLRRALEKSKWCSTDPVCIESRGQGPDNCNLAACHSCALLPETSCEVQNRILDRGLLVGTLTQPNIGFFKV